eukprot:5140567-Prymnesium_polylepis.1
MRVYVDRRKTQRCRKFALCNAPSAATPPPTERRAVQASQHAVASAATSSDDAHGGMGRAAAGAA